MTARTIGFLLAGLCLGAGSLLPGSAWSQNGVAQAPAIDANPIGKVLDLTGSVTIEHASAVVVQAKLPSGAIDKVKVDDPVYRGAWRGARRRRAPPEMRPAARQPSPTPRTSFGGLHVPDPTARSEGRG